MHPILGSGSAMAAYLLRYQRTWPVEEPTVARFMHLIDRWPACTSRRHPAAHITSSAWVVHPESGCVLLTHHRKLDKWLQLGGHVEEGEDLVSAALREIREESGLSGVKMAFDGIFDVDIHPIPAHGDEPAHEHFDVRFAFAADVMHQPDISDESHDVAWIHLSDIPNYTTEQSVLDMRDKWVNLYPIA